MVHRNLDLKDKRIKWTFVLFIFCSIFAPPLLPNINFLFVIAIYAFFKIITKYKEQFWEIFSKSGLKKFTILFMVSVLYTFLVIGINIIFGDSYFNNYITTIYRFIILIPTQLLCIIYILLRSKELGYNLKEFLLCFIYAGVIQSSIALIALMLPSFKLIIIDVMQNNTGSTVYFRENAYSYGYTYRYFGFASTLLDTYGYGTGLLVSLALFLSFWSKAKYLLMVPLLLMAPLLNSRSGLIISALGLVFALVVLIFKLTFSKIFKLLFLSGILLSIAIFFLFIINNISPNTISWIKDGFRSVTSFLVRGESEKYSTTYFLFSEDFWAMPKGIDLLFGSGHTVYGLAPELGFHSDVGYINHLWLVGIFGFLILYSPVIWLFISANRYAENILTKCLSAFLLVAYFVMMIKGDMFGYNPGTFITLTICFFIIYHRNMLKGEVKYE